MKGQGGMRPVNSRMGTAMKVFIIYKYMIERLKFLISWYDCQYQNCGPTCYTTWNDRNDWKTIRSHSYCLRSQLFFKSSATKRIGYRLRS